MARTTFTSPADGDQAIATHVTQFEDPIHALEDFRDGAAAAGGNVNFGSNKGVNVGTPTAASDAATKNYVDTHPQLPTTDQKAALAGTSGTPSSSNKYVTALDREYMWDAVRFRDEFVGDKSPAWTLSGTGGTYTQQAALGGQGRLATGGTSSNEAFLSLNGKQIVDGDSAPYLRVVAKLGQTTDVRASISLYTDANNLIELYYDSSAGSAWKCRCRSGGVETSDTITPATADTDSHTFSIIVSGGSVSFLVDSFSRPISTNIPSGLLEPRVGLRTLAAADKTMDVDLVHLVADRD